MNKKRDIIAEIELKKIRSDFPSKYGYMSRLLDITSLIDKTKTTEILNDDEEIIRYIPLAAIATTETYFRHVYQQLIDKGGIYFSNAVKYFKEQGQVKFDLEFLIALRGKQVTIGEIFSHLLQLNNLNDINSTLTKILGFDFLTSLKSFPYSQSMSMKPHSRKFKKNVGVYIQSVNRLFEYRHILAHEFALKIKLDKSQIQQDFENLKIFLDACDFAISKSIGEYVPEFQQGMNRHAYDRYRKSQVQMKKLLVQIKKCDKSVDFPQIGNVRMFNQAFKEWEKFRDLYSQAFADLVKGGTMYPLIYWSEMDRQTTFMIDALKESFSKTLRQNAS